MSPRVLVEWARRAEAEYRSAAVTAQILAWGVAVGLPAELLHTTARVVKDELDHAALSREALIALGGTDAPLDLEVGALLLPPSEGVLTDLSVAVLGELCLGETLAVPYFAEMRRRARHPAVLPVLDRVLVDEAVHRALGWSLLDALIALEPGVRALAGERLPSLLARFRGYQDPPGAPPLTEDERGCGLLDNAEYGAIFARTWDEDLAPRLARRGGV